VEGAKAHTHQVLALGRGLRLGAYGGPEAGKHHLDHRDAFGGLVNARIGVLCRRFRRRGWRLGFPGPQASELRVRRNQLP
jgi:hypothetical protein